MPDIQNLSTPLTPTSTDQTAFWFINWATTLSKSSLLSLNRDWEESLSPIRSRALKSLEHFFAEMPEPAQNWLRLLDQGMRENQPDVLYTCVPPGFLHWPLVAILNYRSLDSETYIMLTKHIFTFIRQPVLPPDYSSRWHSLLDSPETT